MDLGESGGFGDVDKTESQKENCSKQKTKENPPVKVAGGLGRPFGGSGLSTYPF